MSPAAVGGLDSRTALRNLVVFEGDAAGLSSFFPEQGSGAGTVMQIMTRTLDEGKEEVVISGRV